MLGFQEVVLIFAILLLVFGPSKLPQLAKTLGQAMREFDKASKEFTKAVESPIVSEPGKASTVLQADKKPGIGGEEKPLKGEDAKTNTENLKKENV